MATVLSLSYDEEAYAKTPPNERALFIYEWLRNLEDDVPSLSKVRSSSLGSRKLALAAVLFSPVLQ